MVKIKKIIFLTLFSLYDITMHKVLTYTLTGLYTAICMESCNATFPYSYNAMTFAWPTFNPFNVIDVQPLSGICPNEKDKRGCGELISYTYSQILNLRRQN